MEDTPSDRNENGAGPPDEHHRGGDSHSGGQGPDAGAEPVDPNAWPPSWPRLYPELGTRWVRFVGGRADGLRDVVKEMPLGQLPARVETMGSVYRLVEVEGREAEYHVQPDDE